MSRREKSIEGLNEIDEEAQKQLEVAELASESNKILGMLFIDQILPHPLMSRMQDRDRSTSSANLLTTRTIPNE